MVIYAHLLYGYDITYSFVRHLCCFLIPITNNNKIKNVLKNLKLQISLQNIPRSGITRPNGRNILKLPVHIAKLLSKNIVPIYTPISTLGECLVSF